MNRHTLLDVYLGLRADAFRATKHAALRPEGVKRAYCPTQYKRM